MYISAGCKESKWPVRKRRSQMWRPMNWVKYLQHHLYYTMGSFSNLKTVSVSRHIPSKHFLSFFHIILASKHFIKDFKEKQNNEKQSISFHKVMLEKGFRLSLSPLSSSIALASHHLKNYPSRVIQSNRGQTKEDPCHLLKSFCRILVQTAKLGCQLPVQ